jgi:hypothetical protein
MKMISVSLATEHSLHCAQVHSEVALIDQCSIMQQADYKIRRLLESINKLGKDAQLLHHKPNNEYYVKMLGEYANEMLKITEYTKSDILKCRETIFNLSTLTKEFNGSPCLMVYIDRLSVTSKEKYVQLLNYYKEIVSNSPEKTKEELSKMVQEKKDSFRKTLDSFPGIRLSNSSINGLPEINSPNQMANPVKQALEIESDAGHSEINGTERKSLTSVATLSVENEKIADESMKLEEKKRAMQANLKRYFYSLVSSAKKTFGRKNIAYYVETHSLFAEVLKRGTSVDDWPNFIINELQNNPKKWIDEGKIKKIESL